MELLVNTSSAEGLTLCKGLRLLHMNSILCLSFDSYRHIKKVELLFQSLTFTVSGGLAFNQITISLRLLIDYSCLFISYIPVSLTTL